MLAILTTKFFKMNVTKKYTNRADAIAALSSSAKTISEGYTKESNLSAGKDSSIIALVVYMPADVGNEANHGTGKTAPSMTFGLNVEAKQYTEESDSFDNQYDASATYSTETE